MRGRSKNKLLSPPISVEASLSGSEEIQSKIYDLLNNDFPGIKQARARADLHLQYMVSPLKKWLNDLIEENFTQIG
ncbi:hypothetical protein AC481_00960 [miscellaneous Crenarchaeota group archaeon SMTZ-80]|nr:MAG: hypothetical protein AC481_00960 [miscellaneous Crenarchaeota group archaeon SMTZ-80]